MRKACGGQRRRQGCRLKKGRSERAEEVTAKGGSSNLNLAAILWGKRGWGRKGKKAHSMRHFQRQPRLSDVVEPGSVAKPLAPQASRNMESSMATCSAGAAQQATLSLTDRDRIVAAPQLRHLPHVWSSGRPNLRIRMSVASSKPQGPLADASSPAASFAFADASSACSCCSRTSA